MNFKTSTVITTLTSALCLVLLSGCATSIPAPVAGQSCIKGSMASPGAIVMDNAVHAALLKDGDVVGGYDRQCFAPGKVTLQISAAIGPSTSNWSTAWVTLDMLDGHEYRTRAIAKGSTFVYDIVDATSKGMDGPVVRQIVMPVGSHDAGLGQVRTPRLKRSAG